MGEIHELFVSALPLVGLPGRLLNKQLLRPPTGLTYINNPGQNWQNVPDFLRFMALFWAASIRHLSEKSSLNLSRKLDRNYHITGCQKCLFSRLPDVIARNNFWPFFAEIWPRKITSRDGCVLLGDFQTLG